MKISYFLIAILFISSTCKKNKNCDKLITVKNNSLSKVMVQGFINYDGDYKDTVIICPFYGGLVKLLNSNESDGETFSQKYCWQKTLKTCCQTNFSPLTVCLNTPLGKTWISIIQFVNYILPVMCI